LQPWRRDQFRVGGKEGFEADKARFPVRHAVRLISLAGVQGGLALSTLGARSFLALDADRIARADDRGLRFFIDVETEDVGPRIVAHDIEIVFAARDVC
jgi:hypothetical protein